jgi:ATP-binding cassette, subfamily B, multidrug efflux pump
VRSGVRSILKIFWTHRASVLVGILCLLITDAAQLSIPLVVRSVVDDVTDRRATADGLGRMALILLGLALTVAFFRFAWRHFFFSTARLAERDLRRRILDHAMTLSSRFFTKTRTGEFLALASNDVESVREAIAMGFVAGFDASAFALFALGAMFWLDPVLAALTILPLPLLAAIMAVSLKAVYSRWDAVQSAFEELTEKTRESVSGIRVLRAYAREREDCREFEKMNADYCAKYVGYVRVDAFFHPAILLVAGTCVAVLLTAGGARVLEGLTSMGSFVAFATYLGMLTWPMIAAGWMLTLVQRAAASMDRINALLLTREESGAALREPGPPPGGSIEARGLTFSYPGQPRPALQDVSFEVPAGGSLGLVGEVGSGKSTVAQLIGRLYDPPAGTLFVDGRDVLQLPLDYLRQGIAYVPQEPFLFSDTIAENLRVAHPGATAEAMRAACEVAALSEEIEGFPARYETLLGERGITLSGGQKQRLCLARALLKPSPILVLDDTLSAVDADAERRILAGLKRVARQRTLVVISHRVSAVRDLDRIICLQRGAAVQSGTHAELSQVAGFYRDMVELQEEIEPESRGVGVSEIE